MENQLMENGHLIVKIEKIFQKIFFKESIMNQDNNDKIFYGFLVFFAVVVGAFGVFIMNTN